MSQSTDPDNFFQTTDSLATRTRKAQKSKNNHGRPIRFPSKILALFIDPTSSSHVYIAEAAGTARRVSLEPNTKHTTFSGPIAPLTSLALSHNHDVLFAGCWDKSIWSWSTHTRIPGIRFHGHTDFVKCLLYVHINPDLQILISGSADSKIIIWNAVTGEKLQTLKGHTRGVQALAIDPFAHLSDDDGKHESAGECLEGNLVLFSTGSDRTIRRWLLVIHSPIDSSSSPTLTAGSISQTLVPHATTITSLHFDPLTTDLWSTSLDNTALCLSRSTSFIPDTSLQHPDYVRCLAFSLDGKWVFTGGRDEGVWVWDKGTGDLWGVFEGHWDEVMGVVVLGSRVVSAGIDGTVRVWGLGEEELEKVRMGREETEEEKEEEEHTIYAVGDGEENGAMTEEEERELAELMEEGEE